MMPEDEMTDLTQNRPTGLPGWRFLLTPEDSSANGSPTGQNASPIWQAAKAIVWVAFSVLVALTIGQL
jgi:hypothetical protein